MDDFEIHFEGLDEIMEDFKKAELKVPELSEKVLKKAMNKCRKLSKEKTPFREGDKIHIKNKYKILPFEYGNNETSIKMTNTAPQFHLIERGHRLVTRSGQEIGFVPGKHMVERSMEEMDAIFPTQVEKMVKKILK